MKIVIDIPDKYFTEDLVGVSISISGNPDKKVFGMAHLRDLSGKVLNDLHSYVLKENQTLVVNSEGAFDSDTYNEGLKHLIKRAIALSLEATSHDYSITELIDIIDNYPYVDFFEIERMETIFDRYEDEMVKRITTLKCAIDDAGIPKISKEELARWCRDNNVYFVDTKIKADHIESPCVDDQTIKSDDGKLKLSLVPREIIRAIARARMYGLKKYGDKESWRSVSEERYRDALFRHLLLYLDDPDGVDDESGLSHLDHIATNVAFLCELKKNKED